jgi:cytidine deaminase
MRTLETGMAEGNPYNPAKLLQMASEAADRSYSPYSQFAVGAALLTTQQTVFPGTNVENLSYGLTMCAERVAVANAVSAGHQTFEAIAIWAKKPVNGSIMPCGACLQVLSEFLKPDGMIITSDPHHQDQVLCYSLRDLLPQPFSGKVKEK